MQEGGQDKNKQKNKQQKHICGRKQATFKAVFSVMPGSVSGGTESLGKNARQKLSEAHTHIIIIIIIVVGGGGGGRARRHSPQKNGRDTHHVACLQLQRRSNSHEGLPVVNTAPQNPHRLSAATTRVP